MSIESFVANAEMQLRALRTEHEKSTGSHKGACTRKINDLEDAIKKATRRGIQ